MLDADYRPPVKRGDLTRLPSEVSIVGIVDGVLLTDAAVGHREILSLLDRGVKVVGGGSMGALRAAELDTFGMIGVGRIYREYASGRVEGDDEVVLSYDPFSLRPLSEPLINIRLNLDKATDEGVITDSSKNIILQNIKCVYYPRRNFQLISEVARGLLTLEESQKLDTFLKKGIEDFKKNDALLLINAVKNLQ